MLRSFLVISVLVLTACGKKEEDTDGPLSPSMTVGTLTQGEVDLVTFSISKLSFPASKEDVIALFPSTLMPDPVAGYEAMLHGEDESGRNGGRIEDYWLNSKHVVRVGIAYYPKKGPRVEWATILKAKDRKAYKRYPYPALEKEANQAPEPMPLKRHGSS